MAAGVMKEFDEGAQALNRVTHCGPIAIIFYLRLWSRRAAWVHVSQAYFQRCRSNGPVGNVNIVEIARDVFIFAEGRHDGTARRPTHRGLTNNAICIVTKVSGEGSASRLGDTQ
jgi:hypothetical protein